MSLPDVDHDRRFGQLALDHGGITEEQLQRAIEARQADTSRSLADLLVEQGALNETARQRLTQMLVEPPQGAANPAADPLQTQPRHPRLELAATDHPDADQTVGFAAPPPSKPPPAPPGYEILGELGRGGMGVVYKARQKKLHRIVALKMVLSGAHASAETIQRFLREAEAAARLRHPNIVQVHDLGTHDGRPYFVMEFIEGSDLHDGEPVTPHRAAELAKGIARGIHFAHSHAIIHRDLKPANVLLDRDGTPKITDFGLAKLSTPDSDQQLTGQDQLMGTAPYMPPEQARGEAQAVGPEADVYAVGAILYELLTGDPPFIGRTTLEILERVRREPAKSPRQQHPHIPRDLETICLKCLEKSPARRYPTADALGEDLQRFLDGEAISARPTPAWEHAVRWLKRRPAVLAMLAVAAVAIAGLAARYVLYQHPTHAYFRDKVIRMGDVVGVHPVPRKLTRELTSYFRVTRRGRWGPVREVASMNSAGEPIAHTALGSLLSAGMNDLSQYQVAQIEIDRAGGEVNRFIASDADGKVLWRFLFTHWPHRGHYTDREGNERSVAGTGATHVAFVYDDHGFVQQLNYTDARGEPQANRQGVFGVQFTNSAAGSVTSVTFLGADQQPVQRNGYTTRAQRFADGLLVEEQCLDAQGQLVFSDAHFARKTFDYDSNGNLVGVKFWGPDDQRAVTTDGISGIAYTLDDHFRIRRTHYLDPTDEPTLYTRPTPTLSAPGNYFQVTHDYDSRGRPTQETYLDREGHPMLNSERFAIKKLAYDEAGNLVEWALFGADGRPTTSAAGVHLTRAQPTPEGRIAQVWYYDELQQPVLNRLGIAGFRNQYEGGNLVAVDRLDEQERPMLGSDGHAGYRAEFANGLLTRQTFVGTDGLPTTCKDGYATLVVTYDKRGNPTHRAYFDAAGRAVTTVHGYHRQRMEYDRHNQPTAAWVEDVDQRHTWTQQGFCKWMAEFNRQGKETRRIHLGTQMERVTTTDGYCEVRTTYDERGRPELTEFLDEQAALTRNASGISQLLRQFDERGQIVKEVERDVDGTTLVSTAYRYDLRGHVSQMTHLNAEDAAMEIEGVATHELDYDAAGNKTRHRYFDANGSPATTPAGVHEARYRYQQGRLVEVRYFDATGVPTLNQEGHAIARMEYGPFGFLTRESVFDTDDQPLTARGYVSALFTNDRFGNIEAMSFVGANDEPVVSVDGYHQITRRYERGKPVVESYCGVDGKPIMTSEGFATLLMQYDDWLNIIEKRFLDPRGALTDEQGWAIERLVYDNRGNLIESSYFDAQEEPEYGDWGYAVERNEYVGNRMRSSAAFDAAGQRVLRGAEPDRGLPAGYWMHTFRYDPRGNPVEIRYLGLEGELINTAAGYARVEQQFDRYGALTARALFAADGSQVRQRVEIVFVAPASVAESLGLQIGDIIDSLAGEPLDGMLAFNTQRAAAGTKPLEATIVRGEESFTVTLPPGTLGIVFQ